MEAAEAIRPLRRRRQLGDAQRRGVRRQQRAIADDLLERRIGLALLVEVLHDRLDDEIAVFQRLEGGRAGQVAERRVARRGGDLPFRHAVLEEFPDAAETFLQKGVVHLAHDGFVPRRGAHLGDARSH